MFVPETQLLGSLSDDEGNRADAAAIESIALPHSRPAKKKKDRVIEGYKIIGKVIGAFYIPRSRTAPTSTDGVPVTEGISAQSICELLTELFDREYFAKSAPTNFNVQVIRKAFDSGSCPAGLVYDNKAYVLHSNGKKQHAAVLYGGRTATTAIEFENVARVVLDEVPREALHSLNILSLVEANSRDGEARGSRKKLEDKLQVLARKIANMTPGSSAFNVPQLERTVRQSQPLVARKTSNELVEERQRKIVEELHICEALGRIDLSDEAAKRDFYTAKHCEDPTLCKIAAARAKRFIQAKGYDLTPDDRARYAELQAASNPLPESPVQDDAAAADDDDYDDVFRDEMRDSLMDDARVESDSESDDRERSDRLSKRQRQNLQQRHILQELDLNSQ